MNEEQMLEVQKAVKVATVDVVKAQVAKGSPNKGISKARHVAIVADVLHEVLASVVVPEGVDADKWQRLTLRAALSGNLLNQSQLRQDLEKGGVLVKETALTNEYGLE